MQYEYQPKYFILFLQNTLHDHSPRVYGHMEVCKAKNHYKVMQAQLSIWKYSQLYKEDRTAAAVTLLLGVYVAEAICGVANTTNIINKHW